MSKNIYIIGGGGFIGRALVKILAPDYQVTVCDSRERLRSVDSFDVRMIEYNFGIDDPSQISFGQGDSVAILSWRGYPAAHEQNPIETLNINLKHTLALLSSVVKSKVSTLLYASSGGAVYGNSGREAISEKSCVNPIGFYGIGKVTAEMYVKKCMEESFKKYIIFRIGNAYGPGQISDNLSVGLIAKAVASAKSGIPLEIWGSGNNYRDYLHVEDIVKGFQVAIKSRELHSGIYNLGSGKTFSINEIVDLVESTLGLQIPIIKRPSRGFDVGSICLDSAQYASKTNWSPSWNIQSGILQMASHFDNLNS